MVPDIVDKATEVIGKLTKKDKDTTVEDAVADYMDGTQTKAE